MTSKTDKVPKDVALVSRTKSFVLQGSTAGKIEGLAEVLKQSESAIVNEILEKGASQMILERAPDLNRQWPPLRYPMGRIEGVLRIRRPGTAESEGPRTYSFEVIGEITDFNDRPAILYTIAYIYDAENKLWRRLNDDEAARLVRDVGGSQIHVVTPAGTRWALIEARDLVNRDFVPPLRDVLIRLRRVPVDLCPACQAPLDVSKQPAAAYVCTSPNCRRHFAIDRVGNLVPLEASTRTRPEAAPLTFAQLRGVIPAAWTIRDEEILEARRAQRGIS